jgi:hypothetical protein
VSPAFERQIREFMAARKMSLVPEVTDRKFANLPPAIPPTLTSTHTKVTTGLLDHKHTEHSLSTGAKKSSASVKPHVLTDAFCELIDRTMKPVYEEVQEFMQDMFCLEGKHVELMETMESLMGTYWATELNAVMDSVAKLDPFVLIRLVSVACKNFYFLYIFFPFFLSLNFGWFIVSCLM